ncbi:unnamed protein product [Sphagnum jensenii]
MDAAYHIEWSDHEDGKVQGWAMQVVTEKPMTITVPILMWEAHQSIVTAIGVYSYVGSATLMQWNQEGDRMQEVPVAAAPVK